MSMDSTAMLFEAAMIICWGVSWPAAVVKTWRSKTVEGVSIVFLWFIFGGYVSGIGFKLAEFAAEGRLNPVIALYLFNFSWVAAEVMLYYRYRRTMKRTTPAA